MKLSEVLSTAGDAITVRRVYAEPYERDGITIIAGASVAGGGGGGGGHDEHGQEGEGAGFGVAARPTGAFVIKDGRVTWRPAIDANQLLAIIGAVGVAALFAWARMRRRPPRMKMRRRPTMLRMGRQSARIRMRRQPARMRRRAREARRSGRSAG